MFRFALVSAVVAVAEAGTLFITYEDCSSMHGVVTDLSPTSFPTGSSTIVTGAGTIDEVVNATQITAKVSAMGAQIAACSGDGTSDMVCTLPMGVGGITV